MGRRDGERSEGGGRSKKTKNENSEQEGERGIIGGSKWQLEKKEYGRQREGEHFISMMKYKLHQIE